MKKTNHLNFNKSLPLKKLRGSISWAHGAYERINMERQYNELFSALAKAQMEMQSAFMNSQNPFFKSRYADFAEIVRASRPSLAANGLCVIQRIVTATDGMTLCTTLGHSSGQYIESEMKISPAKADVQSLGSYITYLKRYQYAAITGVIISDEDDDGEQSIQNRNEPIRSQVPKYIPITPEQEQHLRHELNGHPKIAEELFRKVEDKYPDQGAIKSIGELPKLDYIKMLEWIKKNKEA